MNILSLPDEAISLIFQHLNASDTTGTFNSPRHAFALAQTSKRFLRIFAEQLTRVTPEITNDSPSTLTPSHLLAVIRLIGQNLRELHLPKSCCDSLLALLDKCPRLEKLVFIESDDDRMVKLAFRKLFTLPLCSLSIHEPSRSTLRLVCSLPQVQELRLTNLSTNHIRYVIRLLAEPPKMLHMDIMDGEAADSPELLSSLHEACPKICDVAVSAFRPLDSRRDPPFFREAVPLMEQPRYNTNSRCRRMSLEGNVMELISHAHPSATIELTRGKTTYVSNKGGIFPTRVQLNYGWLSYETLAFTLNQDLSRLKELHLGHYTITRWLEPLLSLPLDKLSVDEKTIIVWGFRIRANTVCITSEYLDGRTDWDWLINAERVEVLSSRDSEERGRQQVRLQSDSRRQWNFFWSLLSLVNMFQGNVLWIDFCHDIPIKREYKLMKSVIWNALRAVSVFEAGGGDAGTVRAQLECIEWT